MNSEDERNRNIFRALVWECRPSNSSLASLLISAKLPILMSSIFCVISGAKVASARWSRKAMLCFSELTRMMSFNPSPLISAISKSTIFLELFSYFTGFRVLRSASQLIMLRFSSFRMTISLTPSLFKSTSLSRPPLISSKGISWGGSKARASFLWNRMFNLFWLSRKTKSAFLSPSISPALR